FLLQAEDGIRDFHVTGVQTCALPICSRVLSVSAKHSSSTGSRRVLVPSTSDSSITPPTPGSPPTTKRMTKRPSGASSPARCAARSEERRVGQERRHNEATQPQSKRQE